MSTRTITNVDTSLTESVTIHTIDRSNWVFDGTKDIAGGKISTWNLRADYPLWPAVLTVKWYPQPSGGVKWVYTLTTRAIELDADSEVVGDFEQIASITFDAPASAGLWGGAASMGVLLENLFSVLFSDVAAGVPNYATLVDASSNIRSIG